MVAQHCSITYLSPAQRGDRLTAQAIERQRAGRSGLYDVAVTREDGTPIAESRGHARAIEGTISAGRRRMRRDAQSPPRSAASISDLPTPA